MEARKRTSRLSKFKNKNIVITGASSGIGRSLSIELNKHGANLALAARNHGNLLELKNSLSDHSKTICVKTDVSKETECKNLVHLAAQELGGIDILINNAGVSMRGLFEETETKVLKKVMDINFWGNVYTTKYAIPHLLENGGSVVGVSSITGIKGLPGRTGYAASKFALHGFYESLRMEYLNTDLHVMIACPGFTNTEIRKNALNAKGERQGSSPREESKMEQPEDVAKEIIYGLEKRKSLLIQTKQGKKLFNLNKFFPDFVEKKIHQEMAKEPGAPIK